MGEESAVGTRMAKTPPVNAKCELNSWQDIKLRKERLRTPPCLPDPLQNARADVGVDERVDDVPHGDEARDEPAPSERRYVGNDQLDEKRKTCLAAAKRSWIHVSCLDRARQEEGKRK